jgi:hypothetical protein
MSVTYSGNIRFVFYNLRFLIPARGELSHLASHVLGRVARILPEEWRRVYGHPVYFLETLVDPTRCRGTCYRASNWVLMGHVIASPGGFRAVDAVELSEGNSSRPESVAPPAFPDMPELTENRRRRRGGGILHAPAEGNALIDGPSIIVIVVIFLMQQSLP